MRIGVSSSLPTSGAMARRGTRNPMKRTEVGRTIAKPPCSARRKQGIAILETQFPVTLLRDAASPQVYCEQQIVFVAGDGHLWLGQPGVIRRACLTLRRSPATPASQYRRGWNNWAAVRAARSCRARSWRRRTRAPPWRVRPPRYRRSRTGTMPIHLPRRSSAVPPLPRARLGLAEPRRNYRKSSLSSKSLFLPVQAAGCRHC